MRVNVAASAFYENCVGAQVSDLVSLSQATIGMTYSQIIANETSLVPLRTVPNFPTCSQPNYSAFGFPAFPLPGDVTFNSIADFLIDLVPQYTIGATTPLAMTMAADFWEDGAVVCTVTPITDKIGFSALGYRNMSGQAERDILTREWGFQYAYYTRGGDGNAYVTVNRISGSVITTEAPIAPAGATWDYLIVLFNDFFGYGLDPSCTGFILPSATTFTIVLDEHWNVMLPPCLKSPYNAPGYSRNDGYGHCNLYFQSPTGQNPLLIVQEIPGGGGGGSGNGRFTFPTGIPDDTKYINWSFPALKTRIPFQNYSYSVANVILKGK